MRLQKRRFSTFSKWLMVRMNKGTPVRVTGGDLTQAAGNLYLLSAEQEDVYIEFE